MSSKKIIPVIQLDFLITGSRAFIIATTVVIRHWITNSTFRKPEKKESICVLDYWQIADSSWGHQIGLSRLIDKCINQKIWQLHGGLDTAVIDSRQIKIGQMADFPPFLASSFFFLYRDPQMHFCAFTKKTL